MSIDHLMDNITINKGITVRLVIILILFVCSSCAKTEYEKKRDLENKIIGMTWKQLEKEKNLIPLGEGGSVTPGNEYLELIFQYFEPLSIDEARELVVYSAETFLHNLNSDEKLGELLDKPYPMKWIRIQIFIYNPDYSDIKPPNISVANYEKDYIVYLADDGKDFETIYKETYAEALEKLKK